MPVLKWPWGPDPRSAGIDDSTLVQVTTKPTWEGRGLVVGEGGWSRLARPTEPAFQLSQWGGASWSLNQLLHSPHRSVEAILSLPWTVRGLTMFLVTGRVCISMIKWKVNNLPSLFWKKAIFSFFTISDPFFKKRLGRLFTFHLIIDIHTLLVTRNIVRPLTVRGELNIASTEVCTGGGWNKTNWLSWNAGSVGHAKNGLFSKNN